MAADITIVAVGMVAASQPGVAGETITPVPLPPEDPAALEQIEPKTVAIARPLSHPAPQLSLPSEAAVPEFSTAAEAGIEEGKGIEKGWQEIAHLTASQAAKIQTLEAQVINAQLGKPHRRPAIEAGVASGVTAPRVSTPQVSAPQVSAPQVSAPQVSAPQIPMPQAAIAAQPSRPLQAVSMPATGVQPQRLAPAQAAVPIQTTGQASPSLSTAQIPSLNRRPQSNQRVISPARQILAQVMMESAENQFLKSSGLIEIEPVKAVPQALPQAIIAQGSGPEVTPSWSDYIGSNDIGQVTSVSQLRDVQPTDWAYQATQSLVERYGCIAGYPDGSFRGNRTMSRYEFAAGLHACLERITTILPLPGISDEYVAQEDLEIAQQLAEQFQAELKQVRDRANELEQRQAKLDSQQFSTTTKLYGQAIFGLRGSNNNEVDLFPVDGNPERSGQGDVTLGGSTELTFASSFRGNDLLLTTLQAGNINASASTQFTNMGRLAYENDTDNQFVLSDLSYRFAAAPKLGVIVGSHGVNPTNTFRGISPMEGSGDGALSRLGQRNPILDLGSGSGGAGFDWQVAPNLSLQGIYSASSPSQAGNSVGFFNGGYVAGGQVSAGLGRKADLGIHYLHSYSPSGSLGTGIGDAQVLSPFAPQGSSFRTHAVGATAAWRPSRKFTLGGWGGWTNSTPTRLSGNVQTTNWMGFAQMNDLFHQGSALGVLFGQPPKITSSTLPLGFNFPEFGNGGGKGGRQDTALHLEAFYRTQLTQNISVTPGIVVVKNPNHNANNDTLVVGGMRTTFRF